MSENTFTRTGMVSEPEEDHNLNVRLIQKILDNVERKSPIDVERDGAIISRLRIDDVIRPSGRMYQYEIELSLSTTNDYRMSAEKEVTT